MSLTVDLDNSLEKQSGEMIAVCMFESIAPVHGCAGIIDWEISGEISRQVESKKFSGERKDRLLIYSQHTCVPPRKVLLYGLGKKENFNQKILAALTKDLMQTLNTLSVYKFMHVLPVLYGIEAKVQTMINTIAYTMLEYTYIEKKDYTLKLLWDNISSVDVKTAFREAVNMLPDADIIILEREV
ncbi:MAG: hypothetical protein M1381_01150 [Deltaproteobacteria bacterium]|nr:hypothetical protein [Deltaproteobacteria bacterium]MCL5792149.1 hypothetical protein [Deltaproteobacteria bacterium]